MDKTIYNLGRKAVLAAVALLVSFSAFAQETVTVTGTVTDETDLPMIGAGVILEGTTTGTTTDIDGKYSITVPVDAVLVFNYISYKSISVPVAGRTVIDVKLEPDSNMLEEVVVVGYGTMKRSDLTGSVSSVGAKAIEDFKTGSVLEALGGQIAGVNITSADGTPGSGFDIKIRGVGTVNGDSSPLYIVDGFEVANIDFLANQDIQTIDVLKDASAAAIYGARAANGVVLVTTKSGKEGKPQVTYNGSASYRVLSRRLELLSPKEFVELQLEAFGTKYANTYFKPGTDEETGLPYEFTSLDDYEGADYVDWQKDAFNPTWSQNHDVSVRGGTKETQYTASFSHFDEKGIFKNSGYSKNSARFKLGQKITKWLKLDASINYTSTRKTGVGTSSVLANLIRQRPVGGLGTSLYELRYQMYDPLSIGDSNFNSSNSNPILQAENVDKTDAREQWVANASLNVNIVKGLTFKTSATYNATYRRDDTFYKESTSQAYRAGAPYGETQMGRSLRWSNNNVLTYKNTFRKKHNLDVILGHEVSFEGSEFLKGQAKDFPTDALGSDNLALGATPSSVSTNRAEKMRLSFFLRPFYNYDDRYMITATLRADASTVFSKKHKWGIFPSFAGSWTISNESFLKDADWLSLLKLRVGWGTVGNDRISNYLSMDLYDASKYGIGNSQVTVLSPSQIANQDLKWEGSTTTNLGIDFNVLDGRLNMTLDGFIKDTKDLLLAQNLAHVTGFDSQWQNIGKIRNAGIEFSLNSVNFNKRNFFWSTDFNISYIENTLVSLQDGTDYMLSRTGFNSNFSGYDYISRVGHPLGDMYGYAYDGVYQLSDFNQTPDGLKLKPGIPDISSHAGTAVKPGMAKYKDIDGDGVITADDRTVIGNGQPKVFGGITNTFQFYGVDLSFMFQFSAGNDVYNATRMFTTQTRDDRSNQLAEVADRWTPTNASNTVPAWDGYVRSELYSRFIEDGSYFRLKNLTLGYTFPEQLTRKIYVSRLRLYATATNLFCLTKYSGYDPEVNTKSSPLMPSFDWGAYPKTKTFTFGLEIQF